MNAMSNLRWSTPSNALNTSRNTLVMWLRPWKSSKLRLSSICHFWTRIGNLKAGYAWPGTDEFVLKNFLQYCSQYFKIETSRLLMREQFVFEMTILIQSEASQWPWSISWWATLTVNSDCSIFWLGTAKWFWRSLPPISHLKVYSRCYF